MLDGVDDLEYILRHTDAIASFESRENARA
jgi:hypothetical protein